VNENLFQANETGETKSQKTKVNMPKIETAATPKKVLIVEDEGDMCLLLNIILNGKDIQLDHVKNLAAAEAYLQQEQPSVILLDNKLPDGFGVDFISVLKQQYPDVKIIMISGYDGSAKDIALANGADTFIAKPFTKEQLSKSVKALLN
jgi:two-component system, OmpR family, response regulator